jgi:hypothetical protein
MAVGEGLRIAGGLAGMAAMVGAFVVVAVRSTRKVDAAIASWPEDERDLAAEAYAPEYAAATRPCRANEPCSDFDE